MIQTTCPQCGLEGNFPRMMGGNNLQCPRCKIQFQANPSAAPTPTHGASQPKEEYVASTCPQCGLEGEDFLVLAPGRIRCPRCKTQFGQNTESAEEPESEPETEQVPIGDQAEKAPLDPGTTTEGEELPEDEAG